MVGTMKGGFMTISGKTPDRSCSRPSDDESRANYLVKGFMVGTMNPFVRPAARGAMSAKEQS
jgi:hypothetical protein